MVPPLPSEGRIRRATHRRFVLRPGWEGAAYPWVGQDVCDDSHRHGRKRLRTRAGDHDVALQRSWLPLGVLGEPGVPGARVALRCPARLAPGADRVDGVGRAVCRARLHAPSERARPGAIPSLRYAILALTEGTRERDGARVPGGRGRSAARLRKRVARIPRPAACELHDTARARGRRGPDGRPRPSRRRGRKCDRLAAGRSCRD